VNSPGGGLGLVPLGGKGAAEEEGGARERELIYRALLELRGEVKELKDQIATLVAAARGSAPLQDPGRLLVMHDDDMHRSEISRPDEPFIEDAPYEFDADPDDVSSLIEEDVAEGNEMLPTLEDAERHLILTALKRFDNNRRQTAEALGISERTLYRKIKDIEEAENAD